MNFKATSLLSLCVVLFASTSSLLQASTPLSSDTPGKLIFAADVIRHGDRAPLEMIPTVNHIWPEGVGQLTDEGKLQEFSLGKHLRDKYIIQSHLLPKHYAPETLYARSSYTDRTIMSADLVLFGLYPLGTGSKNLPAGYQPIPVHNRPREQEDLLLPDNNFSFNFDTLIQSTIFPTPEWQAKENALKSNFPRWSKATGKSITTLYDLKNLSDTLCIDRLHHVENPPLLSNEDVTTIIDAGTWGWCTIFKNKVVSQCAGACLAKDITTALETAILPNQPLKCNLYAAHDSTILMLLGLLGAPLDSIPPYASDLSVELFDQGNNTYVVQVTLNDQPVILPCSGSNRCSLDQFKALSQEASDQLSKISQPAS